MICQACGIEAPTKYVAFHQNVGALIMRFSKSMEGELCKSCIHSTFWQFTSTTLVLGWWGIISFIVTPFFLLNNIIRYLLCLGMEPAPPDAAPPELTDEVFERLQPYAEDLADRLNRGDALQQVVEDIALKANVEQGQVALYIYALIEASQNAE